MREKEFADIIAGMLRRAYPDAVSVTVFVNEKETTIEKTYRQNLDGISMKNLAGEWVKEL